MRAILRKTLAPQLVSEAADRIRVLPGDLTAPRLGLSDKAYAELAEGVQAILHMAATTLYGAPLATVRAVNVEGTRKVLELAEACRAKGALKRLDYVSTAFVAGMGPREVSEKDLDLGQSFANAYEQSKFEAEILIEQFRERFPVTIYRPSITVGDSRTGYTSSFHVLYWPLKILSLGIPRFFIPGSPQALFDIVPLDFVSAAITALTRREESRGETFHLSAGRGNEVSLREIVVDSCRFMNARTLPFVPAGLIRFLIETGLGRFMPVKYRKLVEQGLPYEAYFSGKSTCFNSAFSASVLSRLGISAPLWGSYKDRIFAYCRDTDWGRARPVPEYVYYDSMAGEKGTLSAQSPAPRCSVRSAPAQPSAAPAVRYERSMSPSPEEEDPTKGPSPRALPLSRAATRAASKREPRPGPGQRRGAGP